MRRLGSAIDAAAAASTEKGERERESGSSLFAHKQNVMLLTQQK